MQVRHTRDLRIFVVDDYGVMAIVIRVPSDEKMEETFSPYLMALGRVAHSWNHLQEALGKLFCTVTKMESAVGLSIWHSVLSDRTQREMLRAALVHNNLKPKITKEIEWILNQTQSLSNRRNDAIHAPCLITVGAELEIKLSFFSQNPRARSLIGKDILIEFAWY